MSAPCLRAALALLACLAGSGPVAAGEAAPARPSDPARVRVFVEALDEADPALRLTALEELTETPAEAVAAGAVPRALALARDDRDVDVREASLRLLGEAGHAAREAAPLLLELVGAPQPGRVRGWAAWALGRVGAPPLEAAKALIMVLPWPDDFLHQAACEGLVALGDEALGLLAFALFASLDAGLQMALLDAVAEFGPRAPERLPELLPELRRRLAAAPTDLLRSHLAETILRIAPPGDAQALDLLRELLARSRGVGRMDVLGAIAKRGPAAAPLAPELVALLEEPGERFFALGALEKMATPGLGPLAAAPIAALLGERDLNYAAVQALSRLGPEGRARIWAAAGHADPEVRRLAWGALLEDVTAGGLELAEALEARLLAEDDGWLRASLAEKLGRTCPEGMPVLERLLALEPDSWVQESLEGALGKCGPAAVPALVARLSVPGRDGGLRAGAVGALAALGPAAAPAIPALLEAPVGLSDAGGVVRGIGPAALPALLEGLGSPRSQVRERAAFALGSLGADAVPALPALARALDDPERDVRQWAAWALGSLGPAGAGAVDDLRSALQDPDEVVARSAAGALGALGASAAPAVDDLVAVLEARRSTRSWAAAEALGRVGPAGEEAATRALLEALQDRSDGRLREAAARALRARGAHTPGPLEAFRAALGDRRARVRWAAAEALLVHGTPRDALRARAVLRTAQDDAWREDAEAMRELGRMLEPPPSD